MTESFLSRAPIIHVGSTKNLRQRKKTTAARPGVLWFEFTDDYSVFDHGKMPDTIPNKGAAAAMLSAHLFERIAKPATWKSFWKNGVLDRVRDRKLRHELADSPVLATLRRNGFPTHYQGIVNDKGEAVSLSKLRKPSRVLQVAAVRIIPPRSFLLGGRRLYDYNAFQPGLSNYLVPLECVFRFGAPRGSSLFGRLASIPGYARELGLSSSKIAEGADLPRPVIEYFSKLEPSDRFLTPEFALNASGLSGEDFITLTHATLLTALWLREQFRETELKLWDGKFEFVRIGKTVVLGDAITPDELRLTTKRLQISKEPLRQYHTHYQPGFVDAMNKAKKLAEFDPRSLAEIVKSLGHAPKPLDAEFLGAVSDMYAGITERLLGREIFGGTASLSTVTRRLARFGAA
ncbi:MAG: hypothetical protein M5R36_26990 [Deltaproteobacteria bacterium]|nr:hypothetical protein [Deltaproteobacteria bacterium]